MRNSKSETRNPKQFRMTKFQNDTTSYRHFEISLINLTFLLLMNGFVFKNVRNPVHVISRLSPRPFGQGAILLWTYWHNSCKEMGFAVVRIGVPMLRRLCLSCSTVPLVVHVLEASGRPKHRSGTLRSVDEIGRASGCR